MPKNLDPLSSLPQIRKTPSKLTKEQRDQLWAERQHRHKHNAMYGSTKMAMQNMMTIINSKSATPQAKTMATLIRGDLELLSWELYDNRIDLDGITRLPEHKDRS